MSLSNSTQSLERYRTHVRRTLEQIQKTLDLPKKEWHEILQVRTRDLQKIMNGTQDLSISSFYSLIETLNISAEAFELGRIDLVALREHWNKNADYLPERYSIGAFSKRHSVLNMFNYVEARRGKDWRIMLNRHLQTNDSMWNQIDQPINYFLISDSLEFLAKRGFGSEDFLAMGRNSFMTLRNTPIGKQFMTLSSVKDCYAFMLDGFITAYEQNTDYQVMKLDHTGCTFRSKISTRLSDTLKLKNWGNPFACLVKAGIASSLPCFLGLPFSIIKETRCIQRGDPFCEFRAEFPQIRPAQLSQKKRPLCH